MFGLLKKQNEPEYEKGVWSYTFLIGDVVAFTIRNDKALTRRLETGQAIKGVVVSDEKHNCYVVRVERENFSDKKQYDYFVVHSRDIYELEEVDDEVK